MSGKFPNQADGGGKTGTVPPGRKGGGESGGGAYEKDNTTTGDNREIERPVQTGNK